MQVILKLLVCHLALLIIIIVTWVVVLMVTIPVVSLLENHKALKIVGPALVVLFILGGLSAYLYTLYKVYHFSVMPFIGYSTIPMVTFLTVAYLILKSVRFGW